MNGLNRSMTTWGPRAVNRLLRGVGLEIRCTAPPPSPPPKPEVPELIQRVQDEIATLSPHPNYANHYRNFEYGFWSCCYPLLWHFSHETPSHGASPLRVLDVGCGYGTMLAVLSELGCEVHGTDLLSEDTLIGRKTIERYGIRFKPSNIEKEDLPYETDEFDLVLMTEIIEHFHFQPLSALQRAMRVLRPGGLLVITTPALGFGWEPEAYTMPFEKIEPYSDSIEINPHLHMKIYNQSEFQRLLDALSDVSYSDLVINQFSRRGHCFGIVRKQPNG